MNSSSTKALSVEQLVGQFKSLAEMSFPDVWVEGEVSQVSMPTSGHIYFTLKDDKSLLKCVLFKNKRYQAACLPEQGKTLLIRGKVSIYTQRSELQLITSYLEDAGEGTLRCQFELLKNKLQIAGFFEQTHKKAIPKFPTHLAIVTSISGAALQDILSTLSNRYPVAKATVFPTQVQGNIAAKDITAMLKLADEQSDISTIILARGGGSSEDLQSFNDEQLANQIFSSNTPVICGVGHEIDFTIADFVADKRALTPTDAAVCATPDKFELTNNLSAIANNLTKEIQSIISNHQQHIDYLSAKLIKPQNRVQIKKETVQALQLRMSHTIKARLSKKQTSIHIARSQLEQQSPSNKVSQLIQRQVSLNNRLDYAWQQQCSKRRHYLAVETSKLGALSPLSTLNRGYAIMHKKDGTILSDASKANKGEIVNTQLRKGAISSEVL